MHFLKSSGPLALLLSSACATGAHAQAEIRLGGSFDNSFGLNIDYDDTSGASNDGGVLRDDELTFNQRITADNGLTFNARVELEENSSYTIDENWAHISGSFGTVTIGDADSSFANQSVTETGGWGACGNGNDTSVRYTSPGFTGFSLSTQYAADLGGRNRGALAYDQGGHFFNPAFKFDYKLDGVELGASANFCLDTGRILPTFLSLGLDYSGYDGSDEISNASFPNLGVTGVGGIPGVLINAPTDVQHGLLDVERHGYGMSLNFMHPIRINADGIKEELIVTPSGSFWKPVNSGPSLGVLGLIGGLRYGMEDQSETVRINANTPAFGINSTWDANYHTNFESDRLGAYLGLTSSRSFAGRKGVTNTLRLTGTLGYDRYDVSVRDSVNATGLGGALNYNNTQNHSYDDGLITATINASYNWKKRSQSFQLSAGIEYGTAPEYNYNRPDSNLAGALNPTFGLKADTQFVIGAGWSLGF